MKTAIALLFLIAYCLWINVYIYYWDVWDKWHLKVYSTSATVGFLLWLAIVDYIGEITYLCRQIILISRFTIALNFILVLLYTLQLVVNYEHLFYLLNGSILVVTTMILISGIKHGVFNSENEND